MSTHPTPSPHPHAVVTSEDRRPASPYDITAWALCGIVLFGVLHLDLLPALMSGLLIFELARLFAGRFRIARIRHVHMRVIAVSVLVALIALVVIGAVFGTVAAVHSTTTRLPALLQKMADIIDNMRGNLPPAIVAKLPDGVEELKATSSAWLREHAGTLGHMGLQATRILADLLIGLVVGAMVAIYDARTALDVGPLGRAMNTRAYRLGRAFRGVVFGQVRIAAVNTALTAVYLLIALPLFGVHLPLAGALVVITFAAGLLPVIGNLISNSVILVVSLSVSPGVAMSSLVFLVIIHKLEYFLNAHIIGSQVHAHAWELLVAMLVMEAAFGVPGIIAAPIYYAYVKQELVSEKLV